MTLRRIAAVSTAVATLAVLPASTAGAKSSSAGLTSFHGTVSTVSTAQKTFRIKRPNGTTLTFKVTSATVFQRLGGGLSALRRGRSVEVKARKVDGRWSARKVEPATAEDDDGGGHGADEPAGDDRGNDG